MFEFDGRLYLIRHGLTQANIEGICLGNTEVAVVGNELERVRILVDRALSGARLKYLISSSLLRALQTADQLSEYFTIPERNIDTRFDDLNFGVFAGQHPMRILELQPEIYDHRGFFKYDVPLLGGESLHMLETRVTEGLKDVKGNAHCGNVLIVTHGSVIVMIHKILSGRDYYDFYPAVDNISHERVFRF
ncbi:histidine phosphatase family protein [Candidatus Woesearchaeota archaeon]|nr:histidine phosphatase family protein [Candidatus Woesearchaeota archaeon]